MSILNYCLFWKRHAAEAERERLKASPVGGINRDEVTFWKNSPYGLEGLTSDGMRTREQQLAYEKHLAQKSSEDIKSDALAKAAQAARERVRQLSIMEKGFIFGELDSRDFLDWFFKNFGFNIDSREWQALLDRRARHQLKDNTDPLKWDRRDFVGEPMRETIPIPEFKSRDPMILTQEQASLMRRALIYALSKAYRYSRDGKDLSFVNAAKEILDLYFDVEPEEE